MGGGVSWSYFEVSRADLLQLMNASENLPDASGLGQNRVAKENIDRAMEQSGKNMEWWNPMSLSVRQYAAKTLADSGPAGGVQMDICVGEI